MPIHAAIPVPWAAQAGRPWFRSRRAAPPAAPDAAHRRPPAPAWPPTLPEPFHHDWR